MSKINDLIKEMCPNGVKKHKLQDIVKFENGKGHERVVNEYGKYILLTSKAISTNLKSYRRTDEQLSPLYKDDITMVMSDLPNGKALAKCFLVDQDNLYTLNQRICRLTLNDQNILPKYLYYLLNRNCQLLQYDNGVDQTNLRKNDILKVELLIPPLEVQEEIVRILDKFGELEAELEARKSQYEFWSEKLFELDECEWKTTEELFDTITDYVANGSFKSIADNVSYKNEKDYAVLLRTVDYSNGYDSNKFIYIDEHAYNFLSKSKLFGGEIITNNIGAGVGTTFLCPDLGMPMSLAPNTIMMRTPNNKFYYYWFNSKRGQESIESITAKSAMPKFNKTGFRKILVPVPTLEKQNKIVKALDRFDKLVNDISVGLPAEIELRRKQHEYYRNKLLSFEELSVSE